MSQSWKEAEEDLLRVEMDLFESLSKPFSFEDSLPLEDITDYPESFFAVATLQAYSDVTDYSLFNTPLTPVEASEDSYEDIYDGNYEDNCAIQAEYPSVFPAPWPAEQLPAIRSAHPFFRYVKVALVTDILEFFLRNLENCETRVWDDWPQAVSPDQFFFGKVDLGKVDFGGRKSGTLYEGDESYSVLVNYSGDGSEKVKTLYPDEPYLKIWRMMLTTSDLSNVESKDWTIQELRGNKEQVYVYTKMALYIYGGMIYSDSGNGVLQQDACHPCCNGKSYVPLGPSNRDINKASRKRSRNSTFDEKKNDRGNKARINH